MDFDRLTITLLELRDDAPALTRQQEDALQNAHLAHLADLHEAGHLVAAGPLLDRDSPFRGLAILPVGVEEARALTERDPAVQAGRQVPHHSPALDGPGRGNDLLTNRFPAVCIRGSRGLTKPQTRRPRTEIGRLKVLSGATRPARECVSGDQQAV